MSFGQNLQYLRHLRNRMTQEELAEKMNVSRQTVSKWELDAAYPEMDKVVELCRLFSCTMDELIREDLTLPDEAYSNLRTEWVEPLRYLRYAVVSAEPEDDAIAHVRGWAEKLNLPDATIIGWDFPVLSQEQINLYNMHGYAAALLLPDGVQPAAINADVLCQPKQKYIAITIRDPHSAPFRLIPGAYDVLASYMNVNGLSAAHHPAALDRFNREYTLGDVPYMDVYVAVK